MSYEQTARSIRKEIIGMVFDLPTDERTDEQDEEILTLFTNPKKRINLPNSKVVWKGGVSRFPIINHTTGGVALYNNLATLQTASDPRIVKILADFYKVEPNALGFYHGPPTILVKPQGAGISAPFVYSFGDLNGGGMRYTGLLCVSNSVGTHGVETLANFETYYNLLDAHYNFIQHCPHADVLHLESKWFPLEEANAFLEEYTAYYNYYVRNISFDLGRSVRRAAEDIFKKLKIEVPKDFKQLQWEHLKTTRGTLHVFNSRQAVRTTSNKDDVAKIFIQIPLEPKSQNWEGSDEQNELIESYETGRFGNWVKPGIRRYLRENSTEDAWRFQYGNAEQIQFVQTNATLFGL